MPTVRVAVIQMDLPHAHKKRKEEGYFDDSKGDLKYVRDSIYANNFSCYLYS
jgi:hypothetical protein